MANTPEPITDPAQLQERVARWADAPTLAVDTEFVRVDTYYPKLCLIQVQAGVDTALIDPLALPDLSPLLDVLYSERQLKVFHAPGQDLEIFCMLRDACPQPLFDTQIAATLLGYGDQLGYGGLIEKRLGITLDKSLSRTDWSRRPLRAAELDYAAADVIHLSEIYPALQEELATQGRLAWLAEDCAALCEPTQYRSDPADAWKRLKGIARMTPRAQTIAAALASWREQTAQQRNRPRKWILDDDALYALAERQPANSAQLNALTMLPPKTRERHGNTLLAVIEAAGSTPESVLAIDDEPTAEQKALLKKLQKVVQTAAAELTLPASYLAPRAELMRIVRHGAGIDTRVLRGWRRPVCGQQLLDALD